MEPAHPADRPGHDRPGHDRPDHDGPIVVANEFADVVVRRVRTRNGMRLEIWSPRRGTRVHLDAVELECLTWQTPEDFSALLREKPQA